LPNEVEWRRLANGNRDIFERPPATVVNYTLDGRPTMSRAADQIRHRRRLSAIYKHNRVPA